MQVLLIVVDYQLVGAAIARQIFLLNYRRISGNYYRTVWTVYIDETAANVERLVNVSQKVN